LVRQRGYQIAAEKAKTAGDTAVFDGAHTIGQNICSGLDCTTELLTSQASFPKLAGAN
jgi:hypothetical protein